MRSSIFAGFGLVLVASLACRAGGEEVGADDLAESGTGSDSGTGSGSESASEGASDTASDTSGGLANTCVEDSDCELVNDCCNCVATPLGQAPSCEAPECDTLSCEGLLGGFTPSAECRVGSCQLSPISCDLGQVACDIVEPPPCEGGLVRSVVDSCYGVCVPASLCESLSFECDAATCGEGFACITSQSGGTSQCLPLPDACGGVVSCDCVAPWFDEVCPASCGESGGTLICQDGG